MLRRLVPVGRGLRVIHLALGGGVVAFGGVVGLLSQTTPPHQPDSGALELSTGGAKLRTLGYDDDIRAAAQVDQFTLVPELRRDPLRVEIGSVGIVQSHWLPFDGGL